MYMYNWMVSNIRNRLYIVIFFPRKIILNFKLNVYFTWMFFLTGKIYEDSHLQWCSRLLFKDFRFRGQLIGFWKHNAVVIILLIYVRKFVPCCACTIKEYHLYMYFSTEFSVSMDVGITWPYQTTAREKMATIVRTSYKWRTVNKEQVLLIITVSKRIIEYFVFITVFNTNLTFNLRNTENTISVW